MQKFACLFGFLLEPNLLQQLTKSADIFISSMYIIKVSIYFTRLRDDMKVQDKTRKHVAVTLQVKSQPKSGKCYLT